MFKIICEPNCATVSVIIYLGDGKQSSTVNVMFYLFKTWDSGQSAKIE
jgi:hypothetical protein